MITQRKKLSGNGMWESSRMMLPEHVLAINANSHENKAKIKPILYGNELEVIYGKISESYTNKTEITLVLFDRFEDTRVIGVVERVDTISRKVRVDGEWFNVKDVIGVE
ncbi:YolD-like family protein [Paenibacillus sp. YIM B09110]|uniref:YolD-like family protein n=1 Tax=Paenibacillus sp. YIM B09110 TaxID=3126102 RepID=UPI00301CA312